MQLILDVPSNRKVKSEPEVIVISDDEEDTISEEELNVRKTNILNKLVAIDSELPNWPKPFEDFRKVIEKYKGRWVTSFTVPCEDEAAKIKNAENHWLLDLPLLALWENIMKIQEQVEELLKTLQDANDVQTNTSQQNLKKNGKTLVLNVPSFPTARQTEMMTAIESCVLPLIDWSEKNLSKSEDWQKVESNWKLVFQKVSEFADHVKENKETQPPIKFTIERAEGKQEISCHYSFYEDGNLVKEKFDRLPAAPTNVTMNPEIVDGKTEIKWNFEDADTTNFLVRYRYFPQVVWTEEKINNPVFTFPPGPAMKFCVAVDTCFGRSKFSPVIQVPELLQQAVPLVKQITHNTVNLEWPPHPNDATSYQIQFKKSQLDEPFAIFECGIQSECRLKKLEPDTNYTVCIVPVFADGQEIICAPSELIQFTTLKECFAENLKARCKQILKAEAINRAIMEGKAVIDAREIPVIDEHEHASKKASCFFSTFA